MKTEETKTPRRFPTPPYTVGITVSTNSPYNKPMFSAWKGNARLYTKDYWTLLKWVKARGADIIECVVPVQARTKTTGFVWKTSSGDFQAIAQDGKYAIFNNIADAFQFVEDVYKRTRKEPQPPNPSRNVSWVREQAVVCSMHGNPEHMAQVPRRGFENLRIPNIRPGWSSYARLAPPGVFLTQTWMLRDRFVDVQDLTHEHCFNILLFLRTERAMGSEALKHWNTVMGYDAQDHVRNKALDWALKQAEKETT